MEIPKPNQVPETPSQTQTSKTSSTKKKVLKESPRSKPGTKTSPVTDPVKEPVPKVMYDPEALSLMLAHTLQGLMQGQNIISNASDVDLIINIRAEITTGGETPHVIHKTEATNTLPGLLRKTRLPSAIMELESSIRSLVTSPASASLQEYVNSFVQFADVDSMPLRALGMQDPSEIDIDPRRVFDEVESEFG